MVTRRTEVYFMAGALNSCTLTSDENPSNRSLKSGTYHLHESVTGLRRVSLSKYVGWDVAAAKPGARYVYTYDPGKKLIVPVATDARI